MLATCGHLALPGGHRGLLRRLSRQELHVERARGQTRPVEAVAHVG